MIIYSRSPYFITIDEAEQVGSRLELRLWNGTGSEPSDATYTFSKQKASDTQLENVYNIAPFVKEYIDNVTPIYSSADTDSTSMWVNVQVKRYKETSINVYELLDTTLYLGTNGYTTFNDGYNYTNSSNTFMLLSDNSKEIKYDINKPIGYVDVLINPLETDTIKAVYKDLRGRNETERFFEVNKGMLKIPFTTTNVKYDKGNTLDIIYTSGEEVETYSYRVIPICEPKYTPVVCSYINRFGGWQFLTFFKAQTNSISVQGSSFNLLQDTIAYNVSKGQSKSFNINGKQSIKLNTGFVPENYFDLIQDLLVSDVVLLDNKPVEVKTQSTQVKTSLLDRNINYEIDFEYAYNLINNVI